MQGGEKAGVTGYSCRSSDGDGGGVDLAIFVIR